LQTRPLVKNFAFCKVWGMTDLTPTALAKAADISVSYASQVLSGARKANVRLALKIESLTGGKIRASDLNPDVALVDEFRAANDASDQSEAA
jgi:DNA-binding transcriptional regulator YdaS (Cro superfamily)